MKHGFALKQGVRQNAHTGELVHNLSKRFYWLRVAAILTIIAGGAWLATVIFNNPFAPSLALTKISTQKIPSQIPCPMALLLRSTKIQE